MARDVSANGLGVVGIAGEAFRWTEEGGLKPLPHLPDGSKAYAMAVSGDGSVIAGYVPSGTAVQ